MSRATAHLDADELRVALRIARTGYEPPAWPRLTFELPRNCQTLAELRARCYLPEGPAGCWLWLRGQHSSGQGIVAAKIDGRRTTITARQAAWQLSGKPMPRKGWVLKQLCEQKACCNPAHAQEQSKSDVARANAAKRSPERDQAGRARAARKRRLSASKRLQYTQLRRQGLTYEQIAERMGVSLCTAWKHARIDPMTGAGMG